MNRVRTTALALLIAALALSPAAASALSIADIQEQIRALTDRIAALREEMRIERHDPDQNTKNESRASISARHGICRALSRALRAGERGEDVRELQDFLRLQGFFSGEATGYFGPITERALQKWQADRGIVATGSPRLTGWGVVGPRTLARIRAWCGSSALFDASPTAGNAPLTVSFSAKAGGFTPYRYAIDFGDGTDPMEVRCPEDPMIADVCGDGARVSHTYQSDGTYTAVLWQFPSNGSVSDESRTELGRVSIRVGSPVMCTQEYSPVCGRPAGCAPSRSGTSTCEQLPPRTYGNLCTLNAAGASYLSEGECPQAPFVPPASCRAWYDGCNSCARSGPNDPAACTLRACIWQAPGYCTDYFTAEANS